MASNIRQDFEKLITKANDYHKDALWQEKLRLLQEALAICDEPNFPEPDARRLEVLYDLGGIRRRLGQYEEAEQVLKLSLQAHPKANPLKRATVLGELAVVLRHSNRFEEAKDVNQEQYVLAQNAPPSLEADIEMCRAIGNEGMSAYNLSQMKADSHALLLNQAFRQLRERIKRAQDLQQRISRDNPQSKYGAMAKAWEIIGMDRLTLCHVAAGRFQDAVKLAEESQSRQSHTDPTVSAYSKFFYGNALWNNGQQEQALQQWNAPLGTCSSPMAFCKEPAKEHTEYIRLMAKAGVNFDSYDEQGFSALDYAALSDNPDAKEAMPVIIEALRERLRRDLYHESPEMAEDEMESILDDEITLRQRQAEVRRQYRVILQEHIRPVLRTKDSDTFRKLRAIYTKFLGESTKGQRMFNEFHYVKYPDFLSHGKLPISTDGLTRNGENDFVVFISYRWVGGNSPDNEAGSQWRRIVDAVENFLKINNHIKRERLGLWIDYACIDQANEAEKGRGVDALPLAVTLCNAMISIIDETYYERAWCAVEVMIIRTLMKSYGLHQWWEHVLHDPKANISMGSLKKAGNFETFDAANLKLTKEKLDRPKIDFLVRQSRLLGKDDA